MTKTTLPARIERKGHFAVQMVIDSALLAVAAAAVTATIAGVSTLASIFHFAVAAVAIFLGTLIIQAIFNVSRETLPRKLGGFAVVSLVLAAIYQRFIGEPAAWIFGGGAFVVTALHTLALHRRADLEFRSEQAEKAGHLALAARLAAASNDEAGPRTLPAPLEAALTGLPKGLSRELRARIDEAVAAHLQLGDLVADPHFIAVSGVLPDAVARAADEHLADLIRRAPLLDRVRRLAAEAGGDPASDEATRAGMEIFDGRVGALQETARAALQLAATERPEDLARLQDLVDRLLAPL